MWSFQCDNTTSIGMKVIPYYSIDIETIKIVDVDPIIGDASAANVALSVDIDETVYFTDESITFSYTAQPPFMANDFDGMCVDWQEESEDHYIFQIVAKVN